MANLLGWHGRSRAPVVRFPRRSGGVCQPAVSEHQSITIEVFDSVAADRKDYEIFQRGSSRNFHRHAVTTSWLADPVRARAGKVCLELQDLRGALLDAWLSTCSRF